MAEQHARWLMVALKDAKGADLSPNDVSKVFIQFEGRPPAEIKRTGGGWLAGPLDPPKEVSWTQS